MGNGVQLKATVNHILLNNDSRVIQGKNWKALFADAGFLFDFPLLKCIFY